MKALGQVRATIGTGAPARPATMASRWALVAVVFVALLVGCGRGGTGVAGASPSIPPSPSSSASPASPSSAEPGRSPVGVHLTVFAAASLREAFAAVGTAYQAAVPGVTLTFSFDASSTLRAQIEQGATVDLFASADTKNPQTLVDAGLATGDLQPFAGNRLALVVPAANPAGITSPADLARPGVRVVAAGAAVPITSYASALLANLARLASYPSGFVAAVTANVVSREDNVKAVLTKVQLGEADAGIVYATDAAAAGTKVRVIAIPDAANVVATYAAVVPKGAPNPEAAAAFLAWLSGPAGQEVLARFGFIAPSS